MIYCVEDDDSIRELMVYALRASNVEAEGFVDEKTPLLSRYRGHPRDHGLRQGHRV